MQPLPLGLILFLASSTFLLPFPPPTPLPGHTNTQSFSDNSGFIFENNSVASTFFRELRSGKKEKHTCCSPTLHLRPNLCTREGNAWGRREGGWAERSWLPYLTLRGPPEATGRASMNRPRVTGKGLVFRKDRIGGSLFLGGRMREGRPSTRGFSPHPSARAEERFCFSPSPFHLRITNC